MSEVTDDISHSDTEPSKAKHPGLEDALNYPLMSALASRRTRRVARGVSINAGEIGHQSSNAPAPLSRLEEAVLIGSIGFSGAVMHDGPTKKPDGTKELGVPFLHVMGRTASSADNNQATSFFMINDDGIWLIKRPKDQEVLEMLGGLPPAWREWSENDWIAAADAVKVKVYDERLEFPREWPYYLGWNMQHSNAPGTTCLLPIVDNTRQYINVLLILLSEPQRMRPLFVDDLTKFSPKNLMDWIAWAAMHLRAVPMIPYHPIGGVKRIRSGFVSKDNPVPLGQIGEARTDHEAFLMLQNLLLVGEALGLGGWVHSAIIPPYIFERDPSKGHYGLGFRMQGPKLKKFRRWPAMPASQPTPVGIDGVIEGLCPPYVTSMDEAVDRVVEEKMGPSGSYGDKKVFAAAYKDQQVADAYLKQANPHSPENIQYVKDICNYIFDTYGRFPAHTDAFHLPGIWAQFSHLELEYYEKYAKPSHYRRQARHASVWGEDQ